METARKGIASRRGVSEEASGMRAFSRLAGFALAAAAPLACTMAAPAAPPLNEVVDLVRSHATGLDAARLNTLAVEGLVEKLAGQVRWKAPPDASATNPAAGPAARVFDGKIGYVRPAELDPASAAALAKAVSSLAATNKCTGWLLDLRCVGGTDFAAAAAVADVFTPPGQAILDWGGGMQVGGPKTNPPAPLAVLVNAETRGAADALAASLRANNLALLFGSPTGGEAAKFEDFTLSNGAVLQIATGVLLTGDGAAVPVAGQKPDIAVSVSPAAERSYLQDPYGGTEANPLGSPLRRRINEAELVRERRGESAPAGAQHPAASPKVIRDPVLARAVDFLKGLEILRPSATR